MAVPKKKTSKSKRNMRRSHDALVATNVISCENCGKPKLPHHICKFCRTYNGRNVEAISSEEAAPTA